MRNMPALTLKQVADQFQQNAEQVRRGTDKNFKKNMDLAKLLPTVVIGPLVQFLGFVTNCLGASSSSLWRSCREVCPTLSRSDWCHTPLGALL